MVSLNRFLGLGDSGWKLYYEQKEAWKLTLLALIGQRETQDVKASAVFISIRESRKLDKDNLYGGFKPVRDVLKEIGWIRDDSENWLDYVCVQRLLTQRAQIAQPLVPHSIILLKYQENLLGQDLENKIIKEMGFEKEMNQFFPV